MLSRYLGLKLAFLVIPFHRKTSTDTVVVFDVVEECLGRKAGTISLLAVSNAVCSGIFLSERTYRHTSAITIPEKDNKLNRVLLQSPGRTLVERNPTQRIKRHHRRSNPAGLSRKYFEGHDPLLLSELPHSYCTVHISA